MWEKISTSLKPSVDVSIIRQCHVQTACYYLNTCPTERKRALCLWSDFERSSFEQEWFSLQDDVRGKTHHAGPTKPEHVDLYSIDHIRYSPRHSVVFHFVFCWTGSHWKKRILSQPWNTFLLFSFMRPSTILCRPTIRQEFNVLSSSFIRQIKRVIIYPNFVGCIDRG